MYQLDYEKMLSVRMEDECACIETRNQKNWNGIECTRTYLIVQWIRKNRWTVKRHFYTFSIWQSSTAEHTVVRLQRNCGFSHCYLYCWNDVRLAEAACEKDWILIELWVDLNEQSRSFSSHHFAGRWNSNVCNILCLFRFGDVRCWSIHYFYSVCWISGIFLLYFPIHYGSFVQQIIFFSSSFVHHRCHKWQMDRNQSQHLGRVMAL